MKVRATFSMTGFPWRQKNVGHILGGGQHSNQLGLSQGDGAYPIEPRVNAGNQLHLSHEFGSNACLDLL